MRTPGQFFELIFIQRVMNDFKIVPILTGQVDSGYIDMFAQKLDYLSVYIVNSAVKRCLLPGFFDTHLHFILCLFNYLFYISNDIRMGI